VNKSRLVWAAALALLFLVSLVMSAPARLLSHIVPAEQLLIGGLAGTVWQGSASSVLVRLPQGYLQLGAVQWSLQPLSLLLLAPHLTASSEWGDQTFSGELVLRGQRDFDVFNAEGQLAAGLLSRFAPVSVVGMFNLQLDRLELRQGLPYSALGRLVWRDSAWQSVRGLVPLGSYALDFEQPPEEALQGQVITLAGPLQASGSLELKDRRYAVDILLGSEDVMDRQLQSMLSLIAVPEDGRYRISLEGDF
jgi:general secretion pathway protein N